VELGIFSRTYQLNGIHKILAQAAQDGFQTIQFNFSSAGLPSLPKDWPEATIKEVMASANQCGLTICALSGTYNMAHPDADRRKADRVGFTNVVRAAGLMQVPLVTLCTGSRDATNMWSAHPDNGSAEAWVALRGELDFALGLAERYGVALGVEPEPGNVVGAGTKRQAIEQVGERGFVREVADKMGQSDSLDLDDVGDVADEGPGRRG